MRRRFSLLLSALIIVILTAANVSAADNDSSAQAPRRSAAFATLASTYVALNALDVYTTTKAIESGAGVEANPLVGGAAANPIALSALKAASTTATIVLARRLWKKHPAAAIVLLVGANAGMSFVVMHNAGVGSR
jgi:hypothetical protein